MPVVAGLLAATAAAMLHTVQCSNMPKQWAMHGTWHALLWSLGGGRGAAEVVTVSWSLLAGFDASGSSASAFVAGPASNGAFVWRLDKSQLVPVETDPSPFHEQSVPVVDTHDTAYFANVTGFVAVAFNGTLLWTVACPQSTYAVTSPALMADSTPQIVLVCSSALLSVVTSGTVKFFDTRLTQGLGLTRWQRAKG